MTVSKFQHILNDLVAAIQRGEYGSNDQLPAERVLAERYGVARTTARRALSDLTAMGLTVRRGRRGTIVVASPSNSNVEVLNLICTAEPLWMASDFLRQGVIAAERKGWGLKVTRVAPKDELTAWQALTLGTRHLVLAAGFELGLGEKMLNALKKAANRSVILGAQLSNEGLASIICDDAQGIGLLINNLLKQGHKKIALVTGGEPLSHSILSVLVLEWRKNLQFCMTDTDLRSCLLHVEHQPFEDFSLRACDRVSAFLKSPDSKGVTAFLCLYEEIATGALAACRLSGRSVPHDISIVGYGITDRSALRSPPIAGISVRMADHVKAGLKLLSEPHLLPVTRKISPVFVTGGTLGPAVKTRS